MIDIVVYGSADGGEFSLQGNDIATTDSLFNQVYLALFGGNILADTTGEEIEGEQRFDWFGNSLFTPDEPDLQFNSQTERLLNNIALTSSGRIDIENAVKSDLSYLTDIGDLEVNVYIESVNKVIIDVRLNQPNNQDDKAFRFIWDATKSEVIQDIRI